MISLKNTTFFLVTAFIFMSFFLTENSYSQIKLPLTRDDSGQIKINTELYEKYLKQNDLKEASRYLDNNALIYWKHNYYDKALEYFQESLKLNQQLQNYNGIAMINSNMALIYADKGDYEKALDYFEITLSVRKSKGEKIGIISALINQSVALNKLKRFDEAAKKLEEALTLAREMNDEKQMRSCYGMLAETYQKAGNMEKAMYYYNFFKTFNDYVTKKEINQKQEELQQALLKKQIAELEAENKKLLLERTNKELKEKEKKLVNITERQKKLMDSLSKQELALAFVEQENNIKQLENKRLKQEKKIQLIIIIFTLTALIALTIFLIVLLKLYKDKNKLNKKLLEKNRLINQQKEEILTQKERLEILNKELKSQNRNIRSSISYAQYIQWAMFSRSISLSGLLNDSFLIYLPKDIVSGDFYYINKINDKILLVVGDCTGHGVPGAFLTILGYNLLDHLVFSEKIISPDILLTELNRNFYHLLNQKQSGNRDGMDIVVCVIDKNKNILEYAGAKNPLAIVKNNEIQIIKGDSLSIGNSNFTPYNENKRFTKHLIDIQEDTWFYAYSDGFQDQFGKNNKKFSKRRFHNLLVQAYSKGEGDKQKEFILNTLEDWKKDTNQTDDITLLGFKII